MSLKEHAAQELEDRARLAIKEKNYELAIASFNAALDIYRELEQPGNIGIITKEIKRVENLKAVLGEVGTPQTQKPSGEMNPKIELERKATGLENQIRKYMLEEKYQEAIKVYQELGEIYSKLDYVYQVRKVKYEIEKLTTILNTPKKTEEKTTEEKTEETTEEELSIAEERRLRLEQERLQKEQEEKERLRAIEAEYEARKLKEQEERKKKEEELEKAKEERMKKAKEEIMRKVMEEVEARRAKEAAKKADKNDSHETSEENSSVMSSINLSPADIRRKETEEKEKKLKELQKKKELEDQLVSDGETKLNQAKKAVDRHEFDSACSLYEEAANIFRQLGWTQQVEVLIKEVKNVQEKKRQFEEHLKMEEEAKRRQAELFEERARKILEEKEEKKRQEEEAKKKLNPEIARKIETAEFVLQKAQDFETKEKFGKALGRYEYLLELYTELSYSDEKKAPIIEKINKLKEIPGINDDSE